jgi:hypothetical protein
MPRQNRKRASDLNLTPTRALPLLLEVERALGVAGDQSYRTALLNVREALQHHVRYGLHKARKRG